MPSMGIQPMNWRKALHSIGNGECVEVASAGRRIAVRDSEDRNGIQLTYPTQSWRPFVSRIKNELLGP